MGYTKIVQSGNLIELYQYDKEIHRAVRNQRQKRVARRYHSFRIPTIANIRRRVKNFTRLVRSNLVGTSCPALITLTMYDIVGITCAQNYFAEFALRLRRRYGRDLRYISVSEYQERGAVHFHVIVWGIPEEEILNEKPHWCNEADFGQMEKIERGTGCIQRLWQRGFVDCIQSDGSPKLAGYLAKYMSKSMQDERLFGKRAYNCSSNVLRPLSLAFASAVDHSEEIFGIDLSTATPLQERELDVQWLGRGRYKLFETNPDIKTI